MRKPNIERLLLKGSPKQRMKLICEYRACESYGEPLPITKSEFTQLSDSFKSRYEIDLYNKMAEQERAIRYYLPNIQNMYHLYMSKVINLRGLCLLWMEYNREEEIYNLLIDTAKDEETKDQMREIIKKSWFFYANAQTDKEGFIEIITDHRRKRRKNQKDIINPTEEEAGGRNLQGIITNLSQEAKEYMSTVKTMIEVIRGFMERTGIDINIYRSMLKQLEAPLLQESSPLPMFNKGYYKGEKIITGEPQTDEQTKKHFQKKFKENSELLSKYWVFPEYSEIPIEEEFFNEEYEAFKVFE